MELVLKKEAGQSGDQIIIVDSKKELKNKLNAKEYKAANAQLKKDSLVDISAFNEQKFVVLLNGKNQEKNRKLGAEFMDRAPENIVLIDYSNNSKDVISFLEGMMLKEYAFNKYKTKVDVKKIRVVLNSSNVSINNTSACK